MNERTAPMSLLTAIHRERQIIHRIRTSGMTRTGEVLSYIESVVWRFRHRPVEYLGDRK